MGRLHPIEAAALAAVALLWAAWQALRLLLPIVAAVVAALLAVGHWLAYLCRPQIRQLPSGLAVTGGFGGRQGWTGRDRTGPRQVAIDRGDETGAAGSGVAIRRDPSRRGRQQLPQRGRIHAAAPDPPQPVTLQAAATGQRLDHLQRNAGQLRQLAGREQQFLAGGLLQRTGTGQGRRDSSRR